MGKGWVLVEKQVVEGRDLLVVRGRFLVFIPLNSNPGYHYAYEDGTDRKFRKVDTKSSDAGRLPKKTQYCIQHKAKA